jgi:hypothetical protein
MLYLGKNILHTYNIYIYNIHREVISISCIAYIKNSTGVSSNMAGTTTNNAEIPSVKRSLLRSSIFSDPFTQA